MNEFNVLEQVQDFKPMRKPYDRKNAILKDMFKKILENKNSSFTKLFLYKKKMLVRDWLYYFYWCQKCKSAIYTRAVNPLRLEFSRFYGICFNQWEDSNVDELKKMNEKKKEKSFQVFNLKKTSNASIKSEQLNPVIVKAFSEKIYQRIDYGKKYFKTNFSSFLKNYANRLIQKSYLPKNLKQKISSPNSLSFTSNVNDSDNLAFLSFSVQKIFCYYKESNRCQNSLQIKNQKKIENIMNYIENCENDSKYEKIYSFFKMSLEDAYELFYESEEFKRYAETSKAIEQDKEFKAQKRISLLEKNGFIKMIKICK
jgi:hypothetical protein